MRNRDEVSSKRRSRPVSSLVRASLWTALLLVGAPRGAEGHSDREATDSRLETVLLIPAPDDEPGRQLRAARGEFGAGYQVDLIGELVGDPTAFERAEARLIRELERAEADALALLPEHDRFRGARAAREAWDSRHRQAIERRSRAEETLAAELQGVDVALSAAEQARSRLERARTEFDGLTGMLEAADVAVSDAVTALDDARETWAWWCDGDQALHDYSPEDQVTEPCDLLAVAVLDHLDVDRNGQLDRETDAETWRDPWGNEGVPGALLLTTDDTAELIRFALDLETARKGRFDAGQSRRNVVGLIDAFVGGLDPDATTPEVLQLIDQDLQALEDAHGGAADALDAARARVQAARDELSAAIRSEEELAGRASDAAQEEALARTPDRSFQLRLAELRKAAEDLAWLYGFADPLGLPGDAPLDLVVSTSDRSLNAALPAPHRLQRPWLALALEQQLDGEVELARRSLEQAFAFGTVEPDLLPEPLRGVAWRIDAPAEALLDLEPAPGGAWRVWVDGIAAASPAIHVPAGFHRVSWQSREHPSLVGSGVWEVTAGAPRNTARWEPRERSECLTLEPLRWELLQLLDSGRPLSNWVANCLADHLPSVHGIVESGAGRVGPVHLVAPGSQASPLYYAETCLLIEDGQVDHWPPGDDGTCVDGGGTGLASGAPSRPAEHQARRRGRLALDIGFEALRFEGADHLGALIALRWAFVRSRYLELFAGVSHEFVVGTKRYGHASGLNSRTLARELVRFGVSTPEWYLRADLAIAGGFIPSARAGVVQIELGVEVPLLRDRLAVRVQGSGWWSFWRDGPTRVPEPTLTVGVTARF